jgi:pimeloyl-ACP methyl ester carboxylesterase
VLLIGGAFNDRGTIGQLATTALAPEFTAVAYDRRGRGDSGDAPGYAPEREIEDIAALIDRFGGSVRVFGHSSGANLALAAVAAGLPVERLAVYEPPYVVGDSRPLPAPGTFERVRAMVEQGRREDAAALFLTENAGVPPEIVTAMQGDPGTWGYLVSQAHSLPYDMAVCGPQLALPDEVQDIKIPVLALGGTMSPPWMGAAARGVAERVVDGRFVALEGQDHGVQPAALRPVLQDFFG